MQPSMTTAVAQARVRAARRVRLPVSIRSGSILIKEGTPLPGDLVIQSDAYVPGWRLVKNLGALGLDGKIHEVGWTSIYVEGETNVTVFGFDVQKTVRKAVEQILANPKSAHCDSMEIKRLTSMASERFLGVTYLTVAAQFRYFQKSMIPLPTADPRITDTAQITRSPTLACVN